jgi:hypothetical protein
MTEEILAIEFDETKTRSRIEESQQEFYNQYYCEYGDICAPVKYSTIESTIELLRRIWHGIFNNCAIFCTSNGQIELHSTNARYIIWVLEDMYFIEGSNVGVMTLEELVKYLSDNNM